MLINNLSVFSRLKSLMYNMEVQEICSGLNSLLMCPAKLLFWNLDISLCYIRLVLDFPRCIFFFFLIFELQVITCNLWCGFVKLHLIVSLFYFIPNVINVINQLILFSQKEKKSEKRALGSNLSNDSYDQMESSMYTSFIYLWYFNHFTIFNLLTKNLKRRQ